MYETPNFNQPGPGGPWRSPWEANDVFATSPVTGKSRGVCALLALLLGTLGLHYFYIGKNTAGITYLLITLLSCGTGAVVIEVLALVQGVKLFAMTNQQFDSQYVLTPSKFPF